ncbi:hypothetical protein WDZ17_05060 [Pseudokineococcus basanitobsidens]|uniref:Prepilin-type N-terminal cleavage/methylation domain-containing protein n=1 Tax=Pseudokineococcus basanitobsidens TaxID=1926649 RepID=A0ABU8RHT9_9ACTN
MREQREHRAPSGDAGLTLVEVVVAMVLVVAVGASLLVFFGRSSALTQSLARKQAAVALADEAMELVRTVTPAAATATASAVVGGRTADLVAAQWAAAPPDVAAALAQTAPASDPTALGGSTPVVPLRTTAAVSGVDYIVDRYVGTCRRPLTTSAPCSSATTVGTTLLRVVVAVSWSEGAGTSCGGAACRFVLSSLVDPLPDPQFLTSGASVGGLVGVAKPDAATVAAGGSVEINVKSNDLGTLDPARPVTAVAPAGLVRGSVALAGASVGAVTYTAGSLTLVERLVGTGYTDVFRYTLQDAAGRTSTALVTVTVTP